MHKNNSATLVLEILIVNKTDFTAMAFGRENRILSGTLALCKQGQQIFLYKKNCMKVAQDEKHY